MKNTTFYNVSKNVKNMYLKQILLLTVSKLKLQNFKINLFFSVLLYLKN